MIQYIQNTLNRYCGVGLSHTSDLPGHVLTDANVYCDVDDSQEPYLNRFTKARMYFGLVSDLSMEVGIWFMMKMECSVKRKV